MNYIFESRSKDWYDNDSEGESGSSLQWYEILFVPLAIPLLMIFSIGFFLAPLIYVVYYIIKGFYEVLKKEISG